MKSRPTAEMIAALLRYRKLHGRTWKQALRDDWMNAMEGSLASFDDAGLLQQVRNTFGPNWLNRVKLDDLK